MQNNINEIIKEKLGKDAKIVRQIPTSNNQVFVIQNQDKQYMFKIYHSKNWPENGKLPFVNSILDKIGIRYAKELEYNRQYKNFAGGYVIEEKLEGIPATENCIKSDDLKQIYTQMARQIKVVHSVKFDNFAFLNFGEPEYETFGEYIQEYITERIQDLENIGCKLIENSQEVINKLCKQLNEFNTKPCLCHGDLSIRNVLYKNGEISFIDWDDAMALPAYADIARMTYDMMWLREDFTTYKNCFLNEYFIDGNIKEYYDFEKLYHIFCSIEFIYFSLTRNPNDIFLNKKIDYLKYLINNF